jgi:hypothetical protein
MQQDKELKIRNRLVKERTVLVRDGKPTLKLCQTLRRIFGCYSGSTDGHVDDVKLTQIMASRLWYRCGMKLSSLDCIFAKENVSYVRFQDFFNVIEQVIEEDQDDVHISKQSLSYNATLPVLAFEVRFFSDSLSCCAF